MRRPTTPVEGGRGRPPLPAAISEHISPRTSIRSACSHTQSLCGSSTTGGTQRARRAHDVETRLWHTDQKLIDAQSKLTGANLELQRLRTAGEQHVQEMSYQRRLLEREQRERASVEGELHTLRQSTRQGATPRADANQPPSDAVESERVLLLKAQLDESRERGRTFAAEADRRRDEVEQLRRALGERGEPGELRTELCHLREVSTPHMPLSSYHVALRTCHLAHTT